MRYLLNRPRWSWIALAIAGFATVLVATTAIAQTAPLAELEVEAIRSDRGTLGLLNVFIIFFVTLGPIKVFLPFARATTHADNKLRFQLAWRSFLLSTAVIFFVAIVGQNIVAVWKIRLSAVAIAAGILLSLSVLDMLVKAPPSPAPPPEHPTLALAVRPLTFPTILTPFGIAIALLMMLLTQYTGHSQLAVLGLLGLVMVLNFGAMLVARKVLAVIPPLAFYVVGYTLAVLQFALGISFTIVGIEVLATVLRALWN